MPGMIDAHVHSATTLARGLAQEVSPWITNVYRPLMRQARDEDAPLWTMLAMLEGVANGTTRFGDYWFPMDRVVQSHVQIGNRAVLCEGITKVNWPKREEWLAKGCFRGDPIPLDTGSRTFLTGADLTS